MIEPTLVAALDALFGGRVFPDTAPMTTPRPFCLYQQVGGQPSNTICGNTDRQNARIQLTVWGADRPTTNTLMRQAEAIVTAAPLHGVSQGQLVAITDEMTQTYGARQDFSLWA